MWVVLSGKTSWRIRYLSRRALKWGKTTEISVLIRIQGDGHEAEINSS